MIIYFLYTFFRELLLQHRKGRDGLSCWQSLRTFPKRLIFFYFTYRKIIIIKIQSSEHLHVSLSSKSRLKITTLGENSLVLVSSCTVNSALNCFPPPFCRILNMTTNLWKQNILRDKFLKGTQRDETLKTRHLPFWICVISDYKFRFAIFFSLKCKENIQLQVINSFVGLLWRQSYKWCILMGITIWCTPNHVFSKCVPKLPPHRYWILKDDNGKMHSAPTLCKCDHFSQHVKGFFVFWDISKYVLITHLPCYNSADWFVCLF